MKFLIHIALTALVLHSTQACRDGNCNAFCAGEIKDPTKKLTFYSEGALAVFNRKFEGDEKFCHVCEGKCVYDEDCENYAESQICGIPEPGSPGLPKTLRNFCDLNRWNTDNPENEYLYYHDDSCNQLDPVTPSKHRCEHLVCDNEPWKPVCAYPTNTDNQPRPVTFSDRCWLEKFNCEIPEYQFWYWHEKACYSDES